MYSPYRHKYLILFIFLLSLVSGSLASDLCLQHSVHKAAKTAHILKHNGSSRSLEEVSELKFMTYNLLNLYENVGKVIDGKFIKPSRTKSIAELRGTAQAILNSNPDVIFLQEVENYNALSSFNKEYLRDVYTTVLIPGNDQRGINIGFLIKKDLPLDIEILTHSDFEFPLEQSGSTLTRFSRDFPILLLRPKSLNPRGPPFLAIGSIHLKSQRDSTGDPGSFIKRAAEVRGVVKILDGLRKKYGNNLPIIIGGDFNNTVREAGEFKPLFESDINKGAALTDSFDHGEMPLKPEEVVTHTYHPRGEPAHQKQMDAVIVSSNLSTEIKKAEVVRYTYLEGPHQGEVIPIAQTINDRKKQPSDHLPVLMTLFLKKVKEIYNKSNSS